MINKILIVDDQNFNIDALKIIMKYKCGVDTDVVVQATLGGYEAIDIIKSEFELMYGKNYNIKK